MEVQLVFLVLAGLFTKVHLQACSPPILPPLLPPCPGPVLPPCPPPALAPAPCLPLPCPQVLNPNPMVTTIIDNSVSNALVNALQLLIVSNLIETTLGPVACPKPLVNNLGPLLESIACSPPVICPNPCAPELIIPEFLAPCPPNFEIIPSCGPIVDTFAPQFCGYPDISPNYFTYTETVAPIFGNCLEAIPPNVFGYADICPLYGIPEALNPNYCAGLTEYVAPNYYPVTEVCPNYYGGLVDNGLLNIYGCPEDVYYNLLGISNVYGLPEIVGPYGPLANLLPNYCGGLTEGASQVPLAAEVVFPSIPAQLTCNFGYPQSSLPCVRVNVDSLPYDPCACNGLGPYYY